MYVTAKFPKYVSVPCDEAGEIESDEVDSITMTDVIDIDNGNESDDDTPALEADSDDKNNDNDDVENGEYHGEDDSIGEKMKKNPQG